MSNEPLIVWVRYTPNSSRNFAQDKSSVSLVPSFFSALFSRRYCDPHRSSVPHLWPFLHGGPARRVGRPRWLRAGRMVLLLFFERRRCVRCRSAEWLL